jgi:hypothetical protein
MLVGPNITLRFIRRDHYAHQMKYITAYDLVTLRHCVVLDCHDMGSFEELWLDEQVSRSAIIFRGQCVSVVSSEASNRITEAHECCSEKPNVYH